MTDWDGLLGTTAPVRLGGALMRMVESQEVVATRSLVGSMAEQQILEDLLERSKPPVPPDARNLHYLLAAPFRYPPLPHGSRFGPRYAPGIFYGARKLSTLLHEAAYYRFVFREGMSMPPDRPIITQHVVFSVNSRGQGHPLQDHPFDQYRDHIRSPDDYRATQRLGEAMRRRGIERFEYPSAREPQGGLNVGLFTPRALASRKPRIQGTWLCEVDAESVVMSQVGEGSVCRLPRADFLLNGELPRPAA